MPLSSGLFDRYVQELRLRNDRPTTIRTYRSALGGYVRWLGPTLPRQATSEQIRSYFIDLCESGHSRSLLDQVISALKFL